MIAEELGARNIEVPEDADAATAGEHLVNMALGVDPVFAGDLFRLCGPSVQTRVRCAVAERLRSMYQLSGPHRQCALAAMLATGSEEFHDIIVPLLSHDDRQIRLGLFHGGGKIHLSSLGADWQRVVSSWKEEARASFVSEVIHSRSMSESVVAFALSDPSITVRKAAVSAYAWIGSNEEVAGVLSTLDQETFGIVVPELSARAIPPSMRPRVRALYLELCDKSADPLTRIRNLLNAVDMGGSGVAVNLKTQLISVDASVVTELFGRLAPGESRLRTDLNEDLRQGLRGFLKRGVAIALQEDDFSGESKARLATALSQTGDPQDTDDLRQLIRADIDRVRSGRAAQSRGERSGLASGASMSYSNWHVGAVVRLDPTSADEVLLDVLKEAEYEQQAAGALVGLARTVVIDTSFGREKDFDSIWDASRSLRIICSGLCRLHFISESSLPDQRADKTLITTGSCFG